MKIETKYNIGEVVYTLDGYTINCSRIVGVDIQQLGTATTFIQYRFALLPPHPEKECFASKQELINYLSK